MASLMRIPSGAGRIVLLAGALALSACNSGSLSQGLSSAAADAKNPPPAAAGQGGLQQQASLTGSVAPVAFLPVTGAPQTAVATLAGAMRGAAQANGVPVVVSLDRGARYQIKGYFSALADSSGSTLVYVWDVLDGQGNRLHRISGQERGGPAQGDPWTGIGQETLSKVANSTMGNLRNWLAARPAG